MRRGSSPKTLCILGKSIFIIGILLEGDNRKFSKYGLTKQKKERP